MIVVNFYGSMIKWRIPILKKNYDGVENVTIKDRNVFCVYADDDTLWQIFEDIMDGVKSIEFNAGANEAHYLEIIP